MVPMRQLARYFRIRRMSADSRYGLRWSGCPAVRGGAKMLATPTMRPACRSHRAPATWKRNGGVHRIVKVGFRRGDRCARWCSLEFVG